RDVERLAIPSDRRRGKSPADGFVAVVSEILVLAILKWQLDRPVVRQIETSPQTIVEVRRQGARSATRLRKELAAPVSEVLLDVKTVAEGEVPALVEEDALSRSARGSPRRWR